MVVDRHPDRLRLAEADRRDPDRRLARAIPVEQVMEQTRGRGADRGCECVGYQAHDPQGPRGLAMTLNKLVDSVRFTGGIGVVGRVRARRTRVRPDELAQQGKVALRLSGKFWFKGQQMGTGQATVKRYNRQLRNLIPRARPSRPGSSPTNCRWTGARRPTSTSTPARTAGPRSSSTHRAMRQRLRCDGR